MTNILSNFAKAYWFFHMTGSRCLLGELSLQSSVKYNYTNPLRLFTVTTSRAMQACVHVELNVLFICIEFECMVFSIVKCINIGTLRLRHNVCSCLMLCAWMLRSGGVYAAVVQMWSQSVCCAGKTPTRTNMTTWMGGWPWTLWFFSW